ncbi:protein-tyrosine phosphatase [Lishizhenia tianjinensis]|uniref:Protein-tyrosine phosphatase n=1 Tax=Lishizhenia tianjinensis TaxID=477690 RepID=A0A1I6YRT9_9FLAO|nr:tyrosine-protein phosphatase [Lishizhenia tianjinensis]SFT52951.1 protein-tyrosine phosphatase [Lishizhenia tianjinensis]
MKILTGTQFGILAFSALTLFSCKKEEVTPTTDTDTYQSYEKHVELEGEDNMRDMGGYTGENGKRVLFRKLFRSGELSGLTENDKQIMLDLGIEQVIDLRTNTEINEHPDNLPTGVNSFHLPLIDEAPGSGSGTGGSYEDFIQAVISGQVDATEVMINSAYNTIDSIKIANWTTIFNHLEDNKVTLWHCTAGKDRAGMTAALVLSSLGVDRATIIEDFLASNDFLADYIEGTVAYMNAEYGNNAGEAMRPVLGVEIEYIEAFFTAIETNYGSVENFLNVLDVDIAKMQANFLEK